MRSNAGEHRSSISREQLGRSRMAASENEPLEEFLGESQAAGFQLFSQVMSAGENSVREGGPTVSEPVF